jgi:hypothetical protein
MSPLSDVTARQDQEESVPLNLTKNDHSRTNGYSHDAPSDDDLDSNLSIKHEASPNLVTDNHGSIANAPLPSATNWAGTIARRVSLLRSTSHYFSRIGQLKRWRSKGGNGLLFSPRSSHERAGLGRSGRRLSSIATRTSRQR